MSSQLTRCLACDGSDIDSCLDLGHQPLANDFKKTADEKQEEYPLAVNLCKTCFHLQLTHAVNPELMFTNYLYMSGVSSVYSEHLSWFAKYAAEYYNGPAKNALDIGCNDGTQLDAFKLLGMDTFGIDPALNIYPISSGKGHDVFCGYFEDYDTDRKFDIINAANVFAHNRTPFEFLTKCATLMHDDSLLFVQTSQAEMVKNGEFDTIYHEHISFYNSSSMMALSSRVGLPLVDIDKAPMHGTSYVFIFSKTRPMSDRLKETLAKEKDQGLTKIDTYTKWADQCVKTTKELARTLSDVDGLVVGYGAAAKGNTLINFSKIKLDVIVDDSPLKQNTFAPGSSIPVVSSEYIKNIPLDKPVWFVPLAWNLFDEIHEKIVKVRGIQPNDHFVRYFPFVKVT